MLLSIILPTTGRESLSPCLRSFVAAGAGLDDEVVIVVDAIPGEWGRIAATITASQIDKATNVQAVFLSTGPHNDVGGAARNAGLATARGLWSCYMDDDDAWKPGVFAYLRDAVASARRVDARLDEERPPPAGSLHNCPRSPAIDPDPQHR